MKTNFLIDQLQTTIIISLVITVICQLLISLFSILIMKRVWIQDNKLLKAIKMECNSSQDIQFSSGLNLKTTFATWSIKVPLILYLANIIINLLFLYFYNGKSFKGTERLLTIVLLIPIACWAIQILFFIYTNRLYSVPLHTNRLFNFMQGYKPNIKNKEIKIRDYPIWVRMLIKNIKTSKNVRNQALLIVSKFNIFFNKEIKNSSIKLLDYIILNQK